MKTAIAVNEAMRKHLKACEQCRCAELPKSKAGYCEGGKAIMREELREYGKQHAGIRL